MIKNKDWLFVTDGQLCNFRSCGVLIVDGKILIQNGENDTEFALPGGQVKFGETSAETVVREYKEELGVTVIADRLKWVEEVFWKWGEKNCHTICHYHIIHLSEDSRLPNTGVFKSLDTDESRLLFRWVDIGELANIKIYPVFLSKRIKKLTKGIEHFIYRE